MGRFSSVGVGGLSVKVQMKKKVCRQSQHHTITARCENGAHERNRTADLILTKDVLYQLSYVGLDSSFATSRSRIPEGIVPVTCGVDACLFLNSASDLWRR